MQVLHNDGHNWQRSGSTHMLVRSCTQPYCSCTTNAKMRAVFCLVDSGLGALEVIVLLSADLQLLFKREDQGVSNLLKCLPTKMGINANSMSHIHATGQP